MQTVVLRTDSEEARRAAVAGAAERLRSGGVVALPTETVYGLAAAAEQPPAMARLRELKARDAGQPFTLVFSDPDAALARGSALTPAARRLAARYWPGPLTLVVDDLRGGSVGLRVPGHDITREILAAFRGPVALPSANPAGAAPALDADAVQQAFAGRIDAIVDGGRAPLGQPSTVVRATRDGLAVLRPGILSEAEIRRAAVTSILFVCSGNTCRSPMAAALLRRGLAQRLDVPVERLEDVGYRVGSAGLRAADGEPATPGACQAMALRSIDLASHRSRPLTSAMLADQDLVVVMTHGLLRELRAAGATPARVRHVSAAGADVSDPFGGGTEEYGHAAAELEHHVERLLEEL